MSLDSAIQHLLKAKRISAPSQSYAKDNPVEWQKVKAYLEGGSRPTGVVTEMGLGLIEVEDERRGTPPPPPPTGTRYFTSTFDAGNLSEWRDFHDAHLDRSPPGVQVVPRPGGGHMAKFTVIQAPDTSQWGDATVLWEGPPSYDLPYMQEGRTTWFSYESLFPSGNNSAYPGRYTPTPGTIVLIHEWHTNPGVASGAYSSFIGVTNEGSYPVLIFQTRGGSGEGVYNRFHQQDGGSTRVPLKYDHWYKIVNRITFGTSASSGSIEWIIDGVHQGSHSVPTYPSAGGGLGHEIGFYRGPSHSGTDTFYVDNVLVGSTQANVGG